MKRSALKPSKRVKSYDAPLLAEHFKHAVCRVPCVMCVLRPPTGVQRSTHCPELAYLEAHHVLPKRTLRRAGHVSARLVWAPENGMCLCRFHHARHEGFVERVPRTLLTDENIDFACSLSMEWALEREYPA